MTLEDFRSAILRVPLCAKLPESMQERFGLILLWIAQPRDVSPGDVLYAEGESDENMGCLLIEGIVEIYRSGKLKAKLEAPDILGESGQFTYGRSRTATVKVVVGGRELSFSWRNFAKLAEKVYSDKELRALKKLIKETAWERSSRYLDSHPDK